ncbi:MAG: hypothetical protein V7603_5158 [Micromonosporaceae bacterium]
MAWNYMQVEIVPQDAQIRPMIGPGGLDRDQAVAEIQGLLDRGVADGAIPAQTARTWRAGAKDDTAYLGPLIWTVYEHLDGEDPRKAALAWLEDLATTMRSAGADVQVAAPPPTQR